MLFKERQLLIIHSEGLLRNQLLILKEVKLLGFLASWLLGFLAFFLAFFS